MDYPQLKKVKTSTMISRRNRKIILIVSLVILTITITVLSLLPAKSSLNLGEKDKLSHFLAYFVLTIPVFLLKKISWRSSWIVLILIIYGLLLEFLQGFVPGRVSSLLDGFANTSGVLLGVCAAIIQQKIYEKR